MSAAPSSMPRFNSFEELSQFFEAADERLEATDWTPVFRKQLKDFEEYHLFYFEQEVSFQNVPWAQLSPITIAAKGHATILFDTGALKASLTGPSPDAIRAIVTDVTTPGFVFGTSVEYAQYHQLGTRRMPARPPVGITEYAIQALSQDIIDHVIGVIFEGPLT